jgi:lysophospholipase L1-like esterase
MVSKAIPAFSTKPDIIVIALGTNDFFSGDPGVQYQIAYEQFITDIVRVHAPGVPILLATSPMMSGESRTKMREYLDAIAATLSDPKIRVVEIAEQQATDGIGCQFHPSSATQRKMAAQVVPAIRKATGW